ncbi:hypothetical protein JTE88_05260 [Arcanobacterium phocisimile]|uniref:Yip1 domain-containing protein n=1 Tax=Arcanobacterium phocisimile TaxID=1302235 RepID=A0ABX7II41_9ACTO|nr:hypothetical protein [Arcanobacterium phocisimile]QRV01523.1 hypothetical protein JTE88_05260 [Arcanobacterium phocisimile]
MSTPDNTDNTPNVDQPVPPMPQQPVPPMGPEAVAQPGYAPQQIYVGAPEGQYPQGYVPQVTQPNAVTVSLKAVPRTLGHIWHGRTGQLFATISEHRMFGWVIVGLYALSAAFVIATSFARSVAGNFSARSMDDLIYRIGSQYHYNSYFSMTFGEWLSVFIVLAIISLVSAILRAIAILLTLKIRGISVTLSRSVTLYTVSLLPVLLILPFALLVTLLPTSGFSIFLTLIVGLFSIATAMIGEFLLYVGVNREGRMAKSPVIPYVWLTIAWAVVSLILNVLILSSF